MRLLPALFMAGALGACGHSDAELRAKDDAIEQLQGNLRAAEAARETAASDQSAQVRKDADTTADLTAKLQACQTSSSNAAVKQAYAEYMMRLRQLDFWKATVRALRDRLLPLKSEGVQLTIRHNQIAISLPADALFQSGLDVLTPAGKRMLQAVASSIMFDTNLRLRNYQIAGHTDNIISGQGFKDNWVLSFAQARSVMLFLTTEGGMPSAHVSAAGFGRVDPVAGTQDAQSSEQQTQNRRVEMVFLPDASDQLDLRSL